ncbi:MAG: RNA methyltransferase [Desulfobacteraceae bacterium]|nr:RNA methyltransferase [Desulfobacteraceae bacterium]
MNNLSPPKLSVALLHHPVKNKHGEIITSAVTNLDLHDIARIAKTYGVESFYVVTPLEDQRALVEKIVSHWIDGWGGTYNPNRKEALSLVKVKDSLIQVVDDIKAKAGTDVRVVVTCASEKQNALRFEDFKNRLNDPAQAYLLAFGTAWGLTEEFLESADFVLEPIKGNTEYNHLPVRSAVAIILDRLLGVE